MFPKKTKTHRILTWGVIAEPYCNMVEHPEILLAAVDHMMQSSRPYRTAGRWGSAGVTGLLIDSSATNMHSRPWNAWGTWEELIKRCHKTITTGMLTQHYHAERWRSEQKIKTDERVRIQGPLANDLQECRKAWDRLNSLTGKHTIPLNSSHRKATKLDFCGISLLPPWATPKMVGKEPLAPQTPHREWKLTFSIDGSWELDFLCEKFAHETPAWYHRPDGIERFIWKKEPNETLTSWFNRTADFVESLLQKK